MLYFEWDQGEATTIFRDHETDFDAARAVPLDQYRVTEEGLVVQGKQRWRMADMARNATILPVIYLEEISETDVSVRIVSARRAAPGANL